MGKNGSNGFAAALNGQNGASAVQEDAIAPEETWRPTPVEIGSRVAGVLAAAEQASEQIQGEALREAEQIRSHAVQEAERRLDEVAAEAERLRTEAEDWASDVKLSSGAYARRCRAEAEQEAARLIEAARGQAEAIKQAALTEAAQTEAEARSRRESIAAEIAALEERHERATRHLSQIAAVLADLDHEPADEPAQLLL